MMVDGKPWGPANDVCHGVGLPNITKPMARLDEDAKLTLLLFMSGQRRKTWVVNEAGLYTLQVFTTVSIQN
ncbi:MAG: BRO family protein [Desulfobacteraceae bacterium]|jgi:prophage antirepressor-like protein